MNKKMKSYLRSQFHAELARNGKIDKAIDYVIYETGKWVIRDLGNVEVNSSMDFFEVTKKIQTHFEKVKKKWGIIT